MQLVLGDMSPNDAWQEVNNDTTALLDADLAKRMTTSSGGLLANAPGYICQTLVDVMEMFAVATAKYRTVYQHLSSQVKTPALGLAHTLQLHFGGWERESLEVLEDTMNNADNLRRVGLLGMAEPRCDNAHSLLTFTTTLSDVLAFSRRCSPLLTPRSACCTLISRSPSESEMSHWMNWQFWFAVSDSPCKVIGGSPLHYRTSTGAPTTQSDCYCTQFAERYTYHT